MRKPHLAKDIDLSKFKGPAWLMPKIDGVRALHVNGAFTGRSLKPHANRHLTTFFDRDVFTGLDGELTIGSLLDGATCRRTTSGVSTIDGPSGKDFVWYIFDDLTFPGDKYYLRYLRAKNRVESLNKAGFTGVQIVPCEDIILADQIVEAHLRYVSLGYEGTIIRNPDAPHKDGRSTLTTGAFLRLKDFAEAEAVVLEILEGDENKNEATTNPLGRTERSSHKENKVPNGMVGSLLCKDIKTGDTIKVAAGCMSHDERKHFFDNQGELIGKTITYKTMLYGVKDKPRFPTFQRIRPLSDISEG